MTDDILSYREMCDEEDVQTLQRGMNFRMNPKYSVILMSRRANAPYNDTILADGQTIEYQGHDEAKTISTPNPKEINQPQYNKNGSLTQNGRFINAIEQYKNGQPAEIIKVYEKILPGVWSLKGFFKLTGYEEQHDGKRNVYVFKLHLTEDNTSNNIKTNIPHSRIIPSEVKKEVWKRDHGVCVLCGSNKNLHFDHDLPFSKGGTSLTSKNIRLLCRQCNLSKSNKIQ